MFPEVISRSAPLLIITFLAVKAGLDVVEYGALMIAFTEAVGIPLLQFVPFQMVVIKLLQLFEKLRSG